MEQLRDVVRQSVVMAEELQGAAGGLHQQSDVLASVTGRFKTGEQPPTTGVARDRDFGTILAFTPSHVGTNGYGYSVN